MPRRIINDVFIVILVGGKGKRLKPLSTDSRPKAFLSITRDRKTMFKRTVERAQEIAPIENIVVVANSRHIDLVKNDMPDIERRNLILEPISKNTAPAITLAASVLKKLSGEIVIVVLPSDQYIADEMDKEEYLDSIKTGIDFVKDAREAILTLGIRPKFPSTEFGYIRIRGQGASVKGIYKVEKFVEKPDLETAKKYIENGKYLWNTGTFIFKVSSILKAVKKFAPKIYNILSRFYDINEAYDKLPDISIDYAVMEKANNIYCIEGSYRWQDIGSFENLKSILKQESRDFVLEDGKIARIL